MVKRTILTAVQEYLRHLEAEGLEVSFAVVFGSQAAGKAGRWSDIDLVVVSPRFDRSIRREDVSALWRVAARTDSRIEPVPCGARQWQEDTASAVIEIARIHGTQVALPRARTHAGGKARARSKTEQTK